MEDIDNICFVCDQNIPLEKWKYQLQVTATKRRNAPVADLIQELVGEEFEVLVGERDAVCSKCMNLLNLMDSLTFQLGEVKTSLTLLLHSKYNLTEDDPKLHVEYDESTREDREPFHKCEVCKYQTKYEKEFYMHLRIYPEHKSPLSTNKMVNKTSNYLSSEDEFFSEIETIKKPKSTQVKRTSSKKVAPKKKSSKVKSPKMKSNSKELKGKKKKVVFQCSVCNKVFPNESDIRSHCKREHGNDKIIVSDEEEYDDYQTLESSDEEKSAAKKNQSKAATKRNQPSTNKKVDFLDEWSEDEDNDDLHSPTKVSKLDEAKSSKPVLKDLFRSSLKESDTEEEEDEKDTASQPTCVFCQAKFSSFEAVQDHVKLFHQGKSPGLPKQSSGDTPPANINSVEIDSTTDLAERSSNKKSKKQKVKSYKCNVCGIKKVSLKFIKTHINSHRKKMSLQCKKCGVIFKKLISLKVHAYKCHRAGSLLIRCKQCKFKFLNLVQLKNHVQMVHSIKRKSKKEGSTHKKTNVVRSKLNTEKELNHGIKANSTTKRSSGKTDTHKISVSEVSSTSMDSEVKKKPPSSRGSYKCLECNVAFPQQNKLLTHMHRHTAHTCNTLGICAFCEKLFLDPEHLTIHNRTVHEQNITELGTKFPCCVCKKQYTLLKDYRLHYLRCHFSEKLEALVRQVSDWKNKNKTNVENEVYNKVFKELQDITGEGNDGEDLSVNNDTAPGLTYSCPVCNLSSQDQDDVRTHLPSHVQHYCNICENIFRPEEVIRHLENHSIDFQAMKCSVCAKECHDEIHLQIHTSSHAAPKPTLPRLKKNRLPCNMCEKTFISEKRLLLHRASQHGKKTRKVLTCSKCKTDFFNEKIYQNHVEFSHRSGLNCKYCDKSLDSVKKLIVHENDHLKEIKSIIKCNICGKVLKTKQALKAHKSLHGSSASECEVCHKTFKSYQVLREHSAEHSSLQEKKFFCDVCGKGFYYYDSHTRHRRVHLDPLLFQCKTCKERFQTKLKLVEHKKACSINTIKLD